MLDVTSSTISVDELPGRWPGVNFAIPGQNLQVWDIDFDGIFTGLATLTFEYDEDLLGGANENDLQIYHWNGSLWEVLSRLALDTDNNTITVKPRVSHPLQPGLNRWRRR